MLTYLFLAFILISVRLLVDVILFIFNIFLISIY